MDRDYDVIVVGSGCAGVHAAHPLVTAGLRVLMLDGGIPPPHILQEPPPGSFTEMRSRSYEQIRWFVGGNVSLLLKNMEMSGMIGGNRDFVTRHTEALLPLQPRDHEEITQTLAEGGLASAWGGACTYFSDTELAHMGLPPGDMRRSYADVTRLIGVAGPPTHPSVQPPPRLDHHARLILDASRRRAARLQILGATVRPPHTAILTEALGKRRPCEYSDLEYYSDADQSLYRANFTLEELRRHDCFTYQPSVRIERIEEREGLAHVHGHLFSDGHVRAPVHERGRAVILAAGAVGTGRILLESLRLYDTPLPFISKPHAFTACLHPGTIGRAGDDRRSALCQLLVTLPPTTHRVGVCAQLYSYRSFLLCRLLPQTPFSIPESLNILRLLTPSLVIAGLRFASPGANGTMTLAGNGVLSVQIQEQVRSNARYRRALQDIKRALRIVGLIPLRTRFMPEGSSFHYAGTTPITSADASLLTAEHDGRVRGLRSTYVADASLFPLLPAEPPALTIMANARRIGQKLSARLRNTSRTPPP
ncbi:GMC family oxidoreductase [Candidatus Peregrinibacteria bacterium]|nr:GMC family oxidoreductase [Candidatus Peregrinibacteria bacterium]